MCFHLFGLISERLGCLDDSPAARIFCFSQYTETNVRFKMQGAIRGCPFLTSENLFDKANLWYNFKQWNINALAIDDSLE